ncbi:MAG: formylmethanofuran dehydrogenase subunit E family protein [Desulfomonilaceae bacterium]|nr:formylmethanofuran dehydrogenase subunit E family protein [Desulfomonilaceae bacterium]
MSSAHTRRTLFSRRRRVFTGAARRSGSSRINFFCLVLIVALFIGSPVWSGEPTYRQGIDIFIETGVDQPDRVPTWYASMVAKPYSPVFEILATRGTQGRYYPYTFAVTMKDLVKFHGHDCEGLSHAAACAQVAFNILFPDGIIDRSVLWGISGTSPCWSDVVAFLTGARIQYGNLGCFKDKKYGHAIILYRPDTGVAVLATWKEGIDSIPGEPVVLPGKIIWTPQVSKQEVMKLKDVVKKADGKQTPYHVDLMRYYQWKHVNDIFSRPLEESYRAKVIENFKWDEWVDRTKTIQSPHVRTDTRLKNDAYRKRPVSME